MLNKYEKIALLLADGGMLLYWFIVFLNYANLIYIAPEYMFSDYNSPLMVAWNLSFLPIDIAFSVLGLLALLAPITKKTKTLFNIVSLTLMFCAGVMAVSFWAIIGFYDWFWWGINLWLVILPIVILLNHRRQQNIND